MTPIIKDSQTTVMAFPIAKIDKELFERICKDNKLEPRQVLRDYVTEFIETTKVYPKEEKP